MENKNIFEGVKFGDKFNVLNTRTSVTEIMVYTGTIGEGRDTQHMLIAKEWDCALYVYNDNLKGMNPFGYDYVFEVISKYHEPVDENKLDELNPIIEEEATKAHFRGFIPDAETEGLRQFNVFSYAYKLGYKKAKEE